MHDVYAVDCGRCQIEKLGEALARFNRRLRESGRPETAPQVRSRPSESDFSRSQGI